MAKDTPRSKDQERGRKNTMKHIIVKNEIVIGNFINHSRKNDYYQGDEDFLIQKLPMLVHMRSYEILHFFSRSV